MGARGDYSVASGSAHTHVQHGSDARRKSMPSCTYDCARRIASFPGQCSVSWAEVSPAMIRSSAANVNLPGVRGALMTQDRI